MTRHLSWRLPYCLVSVATLFTLVGCGTNVAQTASLPKESDEANDAANVASCGSTIASRLSITTVDVEDDIRYKRVGYDNIPTDARIAFAVAPSGNAYVAWSDNARENVHVTPLTALLTRLGPDIIVPGHDVGGLVAHNDGFALLLSRDDPGETLVNLNFSSDNDLLLGYAGVLLRYTGNLETFAATLTGTASITTEPSGPMLDCVETLDGRLAYDGSRYGAYFTVHQCLSLNALDTLDSLDSLTSGDYADKLVYVSNEGKDVSGGWNWGCSINQDLRLLPEAGPFTALCMEDRGDNAGMNLVQEQGGDAKLTLLAEEYATSGFCSGQFGSILKNNANGYSLAWLTRGGVSGHSDNPRPAKSANDIALLNLSAAPDYTPSRVLEVTNTQDDNEMNLHMAPYGPDRLLVAWDSVRNLDCSREQDTETCYGDYDGTHFRLMDSQGQFLTTDEAVPAPPNSRDDLVVFPNGDVGWAFVPDGKRNYSDSLRLDSRGVPDVHARRQISIARLIHCTN